YAIRSRSKLRRLGSPTVLAKTPTVILHPVSKGVSAFPKKFRSVGGARPAFSSSGRGKKLFSDQRASFDRGAPSHCHRTRSPVAGKRAELHGRQPVVLATRAAAPEVHS